MKDEDEDLHNLMVKLADERQKRKLEWRAQFSSLTDVPVRREKSEQ